MTEDWELSHLPLDDPRAIHPPRKCDHCNATGEHTLSQTLLTGGGNAIDLLFCSQTCREQFYIKRLNEGG